ncbi:hypothetical protein CS022_02515 [Veronia nyctiphanis]|uniref:Uncharacterized protein n=1 Tax=Veronia nyctiphanis TaxID=1278244 RepID=A0A4Q0YZC2_9GAMM|nr:hypothetical protein [Veronia nyctiphanis]RXJ74481.1 hypothetical protein CS022_02515 [Veronia nyctiphanis]
MINNKKIFCIVAMLVLPFHAKSWVVVSESMEGDGTVVFYEVNCDSGLVISISADIKESTYFDTEGNTHDSLDDAISRSCSGDNLTDGSM